MPFKLDDALAHHRAGRLDLAAQLYREFLTSEPDRHDVLYLLGLIALQSGDPDSAAVLFGRAIDLSPATPDYHADLAAAQHMLGRPEQALRSWREAVRLRPDDPQFLCNLGAALLEHRQVDDAIAHLRSAARLLPDFAPIQNNLGNAFRLKGDLEAATAHFREAQRLAPGSAEILANLGNLLLESGRTQEALGYCREAVRLRPIFAKARIRLGNALIAAGLLDEAEACFRETIRLDPNHATAHAGLAGVLEQLGDHEQAQALLRDTLQIDPRHAGALGRLATRLRDRLPEADQATIATLLQEPSLDSESRCNLLFGQGQVFDARGQFERAAGSLASANALQGDELRRRNRAYDPGAFEALVDEIIRAFPADHFERVKGCGHESRRPVFVVGLPRSGTTLVEQILASHPGAFGGGELMHIQERLAVLPSLVPERPGLPTSLSEAVQNLDRPIWRRLAEEYLTALDALAGSVQAERVVDKLPENVLHLGLIATLFPRAAIIHCRRDLRDVGLSCWTTQFEHLPWASNLDHMTARFADTERLTGHWAKVLPADVLRVDYERLVADPETVARAIVAHAGLEWSPTCLDFQRTRRTIRTASVFQVRQPIYQSSVGRWRNYEPWMGEWFDQLSAIARDR